MEVEKTDSCYFEVNKKNEKTALIEILNNAADKNSNQEYCELLNDTDAHPNKNVEENITVQKEKIIYFIQLPEIKILNQNKDFSDQKTKIENLNKCISDLSKAQEKRIKLLKHMKERLLAINDRYKNKTFTVAALYDFKILDKIDNKECEENITSCEKCLEEYKKQRIDYQKLNLKYSGKNIKILDDLICKNDHLYEKLYNEYTVLISEFDRFYNN